MNIFDIIFLIMFMVVGFTFSVLILGLIVAVARVIVEPMNNLLDRVVRKSKAKLDGFTDR